MKKLINNPQDVVKESLLGLAAAHSRMLRVHFDPQFVCRADSPVPNKVALVSGGGSGHEPLHSGFVGYGMLDAACPGEVFTSPTPDQILEATKAVHGGSGVLYVVKNYAGDVMNFQMAAELAAMETIETESCLISDDVAVDNSEYSQGRRGLGATVLVEKDAPHGSARTAGCPVCTDRSAFPVSDQRSVRSARGQCQEHHLDTHAGCQPGRDDPADRRRNGRPGGPGRARAFRGGRFWPTPLRPASVSHATSLRSADVNLKERPVLDSKALDTLTRFLRWQEHAQGSLSMDGPRTY